jgi:hypothetical protein
MEHSSAPGSNSANHQEMREIVDRLVKIIADISKYRRENTIGIETDRLRSYLSDFTEAQAALAGRAIDSASQNREFENRLQTLRANLHQQRAVLRQVVRHRRQQYSEVRSLSQRLELLLYEPGAATISESQDSHPEIAGSTLPTSEAGTTAEVNNVPAQQSSHSSSASNASPSDIVRSSSSARQHRSISRRDDWYNMLRLLGLAAHVAGIEEAIAKATLSAVMGYITPLGTVDALPRRRLEASDFSEDGVTTCGICLEKRNMNNEVKVLPCTHWFDVECIDAWLLLFNNTCPMCRSVVPE